MRGGRKYLPEEAVRIYEKGLPNIQTIQTEAPITAFMNRRRIVSAFDSLELEKRDTVVMAKSVYKVLNDVPEEPRQVSDGARTRRWAAIPIVPCC